MNLFKCLPTDVQILLSLLETRCCNSRQIFRSFHYKSMDSASRALANMEKKGYLYKITTYKGTGGYVYFTTNKGAEFALACIGKDSYTINEKGEQIATFRTQKDNKYNNNKIYKI